MSDLRTPGKRTPLSRLRRRGSHTPPSAPRTSIRRNRSSSLLILNEGNYSQPPYEQAGSKGGSSVRTGPLVAMILLTIFIMIPVFFGVIVGVSLGLACLCFALVLVSMILFSLTPFHFGFAMLGLALIFLSLLALCGLIGFLYGMVKAIIAYSRCFARVIRGKEAQA